MKCPNTSCRDGLVPRSPDDPLARFSRRICDVCGGAGQVTDQSAIRKLGNVGPGKSGRLPDAAPKSGAAAREVALKCRICNPNSPASGECDGSCGGGY